jgi:tRNA 2-thiouridine synthesizing protein A
MAVRIDGETDATLDVTGLLCPLPILQTKRALRSVPPGGVLAVLASGPLAKLDFTHFCDINGYELLETAERPDGALRLLLKKPGTDAPGRATSPAI